MISKLENQVETTPELRYACEYEHLNDFMRLFKQIILYCEIKIVHSWLDFRKDKYWHSNNKVVEGEICVN